MRDLPVIEDPWVGKTLDHRFEVKGLLGRGGMGAIYRCREVETGTELAIKIILADLEDDPEVVARFEREIRANCEVVHPNVVHTLGHGRTDDGIPYFAMELLEGRPLDEVLDDDGDMPSARVVHIGAQIARGLHAAHEKGIVHRDLKPTNVVVRDDDHTKVFDFGLSLLRPAEDAPESTRLTELGMRIGTPMYMAPEYIEGGELGPRADLYALGVLLYECCTGRVPFSGSAYQVLHKHATEPVRPIEERVPGRHPEWLRSAIEQLLEKDPANRPASGAEFAAMLVSASQVPVARVAPGPASVPPEPDGPQPDEPELEASAPLEPAPFVADLGSRLIPFAAIAAVIWHGFSVGVSVGHPDLPIGRSVATPWAASRVLAQGGNPYDAVQLQTAALQEGLRLRVPAAFEPPVWFDAMSWTRSVDLDVAWGTWLSLQEGLFLGSIALLWWMLRPLGTAPRLAVLGCAALMGAVPYGLDQGVPAFLVLFLLVAALRSRSELETGVLVGLAGSVALRSWILIPLLVARGRYRAVGASLAVFAGTSAVSGLLHGPSALGDFGSMVLALLRGDFTGANLRVDAFANHAPAHLVATVFPGPSGQELSGVALASVLLLMAGVVAGLAVLHRRVGDPWVEAAVAATWLFAVFGLPVYGTEAWVPLAIPAFALVAGGLWAGRLDPILAIPVGIALAVALYPLEPLRHLYQDVFVPDLPMLAPLVREAKPGALALLATCTVWLSLPAHTE